MGESNEAGNNVVVFAMSHYMRDAISTRVEQLSHTLVTFCAAEATKVTSKTAKLSWAKV